MNSKDLERFQRKVKIDPTTDCHEWTSAMTPLGYGTFRLKGKDYRVHRLAYEHFIGVIPTGLVVMHKCDNRKCVNPSHLKVGTQKENLQDMSNKGRGSRQVDPNLVQTFQKLYAEGMRIEEIAKMHNVSRHTIGRHVKGWGR